MLCGGAMAQFARSQTTSPDFPMFGGDVSQTRKKYSKSSDWERVQANAPSGAYERFLDSLRNPQTGGRSGVVGPMLVGGTGELIKGAGALTQMAFPETGTRMVEVGEAMTEGAKSVAPVSGTVGQIGSYLVPYGAAQKATTALARPALPPLGVVYI